MNIEALISKAAGEAVKALYGMDATDKMLQLQKTRSEFEGNLTLVVFPFVKAAKKSPEQTAQEIGEYLQEHCVAVDKFNVVKGFLNLSIGDGAWLQLLDAIDKDEHYGEKQADGEYVLLLNNDTKVISPDWIEELLMYAQRRMTMTPTRETWIRRGIFAAIALALVLFAYAVYLQYLI